MTPIPQKPEFLRFDGADERNNRYGWFRCSCGKEFRRMVTRVVNGYVKSCGCYQKARLSETHMRHGDSPNGPNGSPREYTIWWGMKTRCYNRNFKWYHRYGGRGIKICERWHTYQNFLSDMGRSPTPGHTIERINNDGDYCPENCVWATFDRQANNRSNNRKLTIYGVTRSITDWCREAGISVPCVTYRIKMGWDIKEAVFTKPRGRTAKREEALLP